MRAALTLLEVVIGLALFATVMVAVIESTAAVRSYAVMHERTDDLESEGRTILRQLSADLSNAAWYFDRSDPTVAAVPLLPRVVRAADPAASLGDELVFLKLRTERNVNNNPAVLQVEHVNLSGAAPRRMADYATAPVVYSLVLNEGFVDNGSMPFVSTVWESYEGGLTHAENQDRTRLRHYRYAVVPNPQTGRGELRRFYCNGLPVDEGGSEAWVSDNDQAWGRHIASLRFDTFVTTAGTGQRRLSPNQIRVHLELRHDGQDGRASARRVFQATIALRSITNETTN